MTFYDDITTKQLMNKLGAQREAFFFVISYDMQSNIILPLAEVKSSDILYKFNKITNDIDNTKSNNIFSIIGSKPLTYKEYKKGYDVVRENLLYGNSYLCNLTVETQIDIDASLLDIYKSAKAKYKLLLSNQFVCFSPETFIQIRDSKIYTYPMKGTIDAAEKDALNTILSDKKETAEHNTIVDLLRNDLGIVSKNVRVTKYRYHDILETSNKKLIQISSEIVGDLAENYYTKLGDIIFSMLPAGSVTGAPKNKTLQIISQAEKHTRNYYTGITGFFDGKNLDSAVMIRFIEHREGKYYYKSGGGITIYSDPEKEYQEMNDKIYVPIY